MRIREPGWLCIFKKIELGLGIVIKNWRIVFSQSYLANNRCIERCKGKIVLNLNNRYENKAKTEVVT
jgi:hypothetical protein